MAARCGQSLIVAPFVGAPNQMIDLHGLRADNDLWIRIPPLVFAMPPFLSVLAIVIGGFAQGLAGRLYPIASGMVVIAYATVFLLVIDLDRPASGFSFVNQAPMVERRGGIQVPLEQGPPEQIR